MHLPRKYAPIIRETVRMTKFIHDNAINRIIVGGSSAQQVAFIVRQVWEKNYLAERMPTFTALGVTNKATIVIAKNGKELTKLYNPSQEKIKKLKQHKLFVKTIINQSPKYGRNQSGVDIEKTLAKRVKNIDLTEKVFVLEEMVANFTQMDKMNYPTGASPGVSDGNSNNFICA
ncbi:MAG: hypothetical protein WCI04_03180 [archaeon]